MRTNSSVWILATVSMGVLGGVVPKPYELNKTTTSGIPQRYAYGTRLPIPVPIRPSSCISCKTYETTTNSSTQTALSLSHPSATVPNQIPSLSPTYAVLPVSSLPSTTVNISVQSPSLVYPPLSSSAMLTHLPPTPAYISDYTSVVTMIVSKTVFNTPTATSSVNEHSISLPSSTSGLSSPQPAITAFAVSSTSVGAPSAGESSVFSSIADVKFRVALQASPTINLGLLSSIFYGSDAIQRSFSTRTTTVTTVVIINITVPGPLPTSLLGLLSTTPTTAITNSVAVLPSPSRSATTTSPAATSTNVLGPSLSTSGSASRSLTTLTPTTAYPSEVATTDFPILPPFSYNPSASRGSASPITRPTPEPSSANVAGSKIGTTTVSTSTFISQYSGIPPAPSAAGASGGLNGKAKETVWWVVFFIPLMLLA